MLLCTSSWSADGDTFIANTVEGVSMTFKVISESEKTCQVGNGNNPAIPSDYTGLITIPLSANGYSVTSIGDFAFYNCKGLTSVTISEGLMSISDHAFVSCSGLTSITIPSSVTSIGNGAFWGCSRLASITIPSSVTSINSQTFYYCSSLSSIYISPCVTSIEGSAFSGCSSLTTIIVNGHNPKYDSRENCNAIIETKSNTLIAGCKNTIIPPSVTSIWDGAFLDCIYLTSITIPSSIKSIGYNAFENCSGLTSITIPSSVTSIGDKAFYGCSSLTSVVVKNSTPVSISSSTFSNRANATLYVPAGCKAAYEAENYWKEFKEIKESTSLAISDASGLVGCTFTLSINMTNEDEITAMQFELSLPEGVSVADATLTDRKNGHSIDYTLQENGNYQFTVFSSSSKAINGSEGDVANISLSISGSMAAGSYTIQMKNIELTTTAGDAIHQSDLSATLTVLNLKPGDVNGDDKLSITDAVGIVNYILGKTSANFHPEAADLNGDGGVSITDAVRVVNIILNQGSGVKERRTHEVETEREPQ